MCNRKNVVMKIGIISDLHLEFRDTAQSVSLLDSIKEHDYDVLVMAGDVHPNRLLHDYTIKVLEEKSPVVWTNGNHDFYNSQGVYNDFKTEKINGVTFASCCYWTCFNYDWYAQHFSKRGIQDFMSIPNWDTNACVVMHESQRNSLLMEAGFVDVVITHFPPSMKALDKKYEGSILNDYFINSEDDVVEAVHPKIWVSGHTHSKFDFKIKETRVIGNPLGYPRESFKSDKEYKPIIVEI